MIKRYFVCLGLLLILPLTLFAWDAELIRAADAVANHPDRVTKRQKGLVYKYQAEINRMRMKGVELDGIHMTDDIYQKCRSFYDSELEIQAKEACRRNGIDFEVQQRDPNKRVDAGTDTDLITNAKNTDQIRNTIKDFNSIANRYLEDCGLDVSDNRNHAKHNDVDFMADPTGVSRADFEEIARINNDAYRRPEAAVYEAKVRAGMIPTEVETRAYKDEMAEFIDKKTREIHQLRREVEALRPKADQLESPENWRKRMDLEAKLQQKQAHKAKYFDRNLEATRRMADAERIKLQDSYMSADDRKKAFQNLQYEDSNLPEKAKKRAPGEGISASQRSITSATAESMSDQLMQSDRLNEGAILAMRARNDPSTIEDGVKRILENSGQMTPSQKGEMILRLQNAGAPEAMIDKVIQNMGGKGSLPVETKSGKILTDANHLPSNGKSGKHRGYAESLNPFSGWGSVGSLEKTGMGIGFVGDIMSIDQQLENAKRGTHLFVNFDENDSELERSAKEAAVAGLELLPIPILDSMERGWIAEKEVREFNNMVLEEYGVDLSYMEFDQLKLLVGFQTAKSFFWDPWAQPTGEVFSFGFESWNNWETITGAARHNSDQLDDLLARAATINMGDVWTHLGGYDGLSIQGPVNSGDTLAFTVYADETWLDKYSVRWDLLSPKNSVLLDKGPLNANEPEAHRFLVEAVNFDPGTYSVFCRVFDKATGKQINTRSAKFNVVPEEGIHLGPIIAIKDSSNGDRIDGSAKIEGELFFQVDRMGTWDDNKTIEWLLNGEVFQKKLASESDANLIRLKPTSYFEGEYEIVIRVIEKGKIKDHEKYTLQLESPFKLEMMTCFFSQAKENWIEHKTTEINAGEQVQCYAGVAGTWCKQVKHYLTVYDDANNVVVQRFQLHPRHYIEVDHDNLEFIGVNTPATVTTKSASLKYAFESIAESGEKITFSEILKIRHIALPLRLECPSVCMVREETPIQVVSPKGFEAPYTVNIRWEIDEYAEEIEDESFNDVVVFDDDSGDTGDHQNDVLDLKWDNSEPLRIPEPNPYRSRRHWNIRNVNRLPDFLDSTHDEMTATLFLEITDAKGRKAKTQKTIGFMHDQSPFEVQSVRLTRLNGQGIDKVRSDMPIYIKARVSKPIRSGDIYLNFVEQDTGKEKMYWKTRFFLDEGRLTNQELIFEIPEYLLTWGGWKNLELQVYMENDNGEGSNIESTQFRVIPDPLKIICPNQIMAGVETPFRIVPPSHFEPPISWEFCDCPRSFLIWSKDTNSTGTEGVFFGNVEGQPQTGVFKIGIFDSKNRVAVGKARVHVSLNPEWEKSIWDDMGEFIGGLAEGIATGLSIAAETIEEYDDRDYPTLLEDSDDTWEDDIDDEDIIKLANFEESGGNSNKGRSNGFKTDTVSFTASKRIGNSGFSVSLGCSGGGDWNAQWEVEYRLYLGQDPVYNPSGNDALQGATRISSNDTSSADFEKNLAMYDRIQNKNPNHWKQVLVCVRDMEVTYPASMSLEAYLQKLVNRGGLPSGATRWVR